MFIKIKWMHMAYVRNKRTDDNSIGSVNLSDNGCAEEQKDGH